jgi:polar amino acid transport system substrate-binding protein
MNGFPTLALLLALLCGGPALAEHLRLSGDSWPPFTDQRLPNNGLAVDLVSTALQRAGHTT